MSKQILFLIHGNGVHGSDWAEAPDGPADTLRRLSGRYEHFDGNPLDSEIEMVPITYDDIFRDVAERWRDSADGLNGLEPGYGVWGSSDAKDAVLGWLEGAGNDDDFWWTHASDVVMYRLIPFYRNRVRTHVLDTIRERLEQEFANEQVPECSVLAHSLGTVVAHDCLHLLGSRRWGGRLNAMGPAHWRFQSFFMVSNTSKLLENLNDDVPDPYESIVRPGPAETEGSYCGSYWDFRHDVDYVTWLLRFDPQGWGDGYHSVVVSHYRQYDVHGLSHYLENPRVHIPILRAAHWNAVTEDEERDALDPESFPQFDGDLEFVGKLHELKEELTAFAGSHPDSGSITDWLDTMVGYYKIARSYL
jgi:hypothetical protein